MPVLDTVSSDSTLQNVAAMLWCKRNDSMQYSAFADAADLEGHRETALLFLAMARSEQVQAESLVKVVRKMGEVSEVADVLFADAPIQVQGIRKNLATAIAFESRECKTMYPNFMKIAESQGYPEARRVFQNTLESDEEHLRMCGEALAALPEASQNERQPSARAQEPRATKPTSILLECTPWYWLRSYPPNGSRFLMEAPLGVSSRASRPRAAVRMPYFVCPRCGYMIEDFNYLRCRGCSSATCCGCACVRAQRMRLSGKRKRATLLQVRQTGTSDSHA
jgi:rubrerythrin